MLLYLEIKKPSILEIAHRKIAYGSDSLGKVTGIPWKGRAYLRAKYPGAFPLSGSKIEVLLGFAREAPTNAYKVAKTTGKAYSFVFNTLKELERRKKVVFKGKQRTEKGTTANIYDLSLEGVLLTLKTEMRLADTDEWNRKFIRRIIEKYSPLLPLVFGKWDHLVKMGVEKPALIRLKIVVDNLHMLRRGDPTVPGKTIEQKINWFFYLGSVYKFSFLLAKDPIVWVNAWKEDDEIRAFCIEEIEQHVRRYEDAIILYKKYLFSLKGIESNAVV